MKKLLFLIMFFMLTMSLKAQVLYNHYYCSDPYCIGLLATVGVNFEGNSEKEIILPVPPEGVKTVSGACNPVITNFLGSTFSVRLTFDESVVGDPDASFAVITNKTGYGTSPHHDYQRELIYHV